jgi:alkaline phosphatase
MKMIPIFKRLIITCLVVCSLFFSAFSLAARQTSPKYIFMFIGDGMGIAQRQVAELQLNSSRYQPPRDQKIKLTMNSLKYSGVTTTYDSTSVVPDSASTATALSSGYKTLSGVIGMREDKKTVTPNISEALKKKGYAIGIISSVKIVHATPAAFYSHIDNRNKYDDIAVQMINSKFDLFVGGGGDKHFNGKKRKDHRDIYQEAAAKGFYVARTSQGFMDAKPGEKVLANLPGDVYDSALPYAIDRQKDDLSMSQIVRKSISLLAPNKKGFFMMVEGGKIDWACHANDTGAAIGNMIDFDKAIKVAVEFKKKNPNTLIIVTGDHECGGLGLSMGKEYRVNPELFLDQKISFEIADQKIANILKTEEEPALKIFQVAEEFGLTNLTAEEKGEIIKSIQVQKDGLTKIQSNKLYGGYKPISMTFRRLLNIRANLFWTSYAHTGIPVMTTAEGVGAQQFVGYTDNTDICKALNQVTHAGLKW